jgi:hypothetical protein
VLTLVVLEFWGEQNISENEFGEGVGVVLVFYFVLASGRREYFYSFESKYFYSALTKRRDPDGLYICKR